MDTLCEEQAVITFKVGYPSFVQSVPEIPAPEWVRINWTTVELAKQPQIRWAGEEIVLEKRWALPGEWYPNLGGGIDNDGDGRINEDPADDDGDGLINEEFGGTAGVDDDEDANEDGTRAEPGFGNCDDGVDNDGDTDVDQGRTPVAPTSSTRTPASTQTRTTTSDCVGDPPPPPSPDLDSCSLAGGIDEDGPDACPWTATPSSTPSWAAPAA